MKVGKTGVSGSAPSNSTKPATPAKGDARVESLSPSQPVKDTASVLGIPASDMTPKVRDAIMTLMAEVGRLRQDLEMAQRRLAEMERLADLDPLVPIANRRAFVREISRLISFAERYDVVSSLIFFDVNNMKEINDEYGHAAGDKALHHVADTILSNIRESDYIGRLGGDEFGVLLVQANEDAAKHKAKELADAVESDAFVWEGKKVRVGLAYGVHTFGPGHDASDAIASADRRMYEHKRELRRESR